MADFSTHLIGATAAGSLAATVVAKVLGLPADHSLLLIGSCIVGGVLPDIDLQRSTPSRILFTVFGVASAIAWVFARVDDYSALALWSTGLVIFIGIRWPLSWVFGTLTVHRGATHSLLACAATLLAVAAVSYQLTGADALLAWLVGLFTAIGYLVHLLLDELWSVDFAGVKIKRSFGTALKPVDTRRWAGSVVLLVIAFASSLYLPPTTPIRTAAGTVIAALLAGEPGVILP